MTTDLKNFAGLILLIFTLPAFAQVPCSDAAAQNMLQNRYYGFEENCGQIKDQSGIARKDVKYLYTAPGLKLALKNNSFAYEIYTLEKKNSGKVFSEATGEINAGAEKIFVKAQVVDVTFSGANPHPVLIAGEKSEGFNNYYLTNLPEEGIRNVYSYNKLTYKNLYPNIDIVFYAGQAGKLKYDIVVHPGGKLEDVKMNYSGARGLAMDGGKLKLKTLLGEIEEDIPYSFLKENNKEVFVKHRLDNNQISFKCNYDNRKTLVIDPVLSWATYVGGLALESGTDIATDANGNVFVSGFGGSLQGIATSGAHQQNHSYYTYPLSGSEALLMKFNSSGTRQWGTYYGGNYDDYGMGVTTDPGGNVYMVGWTGSHSMELITSGAHKSVPDSTIDVFIAKFNTNGVRQWGTHFGGRGNDFGNSIITDDSSNIYISGQTTSTAGIATSGTHQSTYGGGNYDAFVAKFTTHGNQLWGSYFGGSGFEDCRGISLDSSRNIYIGGTTASTSGIATSGAYQTTYAGGTYDAFIAKFSNSGALEWGTYYGGSSLDNGYNITTDKAGNSYLAGYTASTSGIATSGVHQTSFGGGNYDAFVTRFNTDGARKWGTYYGGSEGDEGLKINNGRNGGVYFTGRTKSTSGIATSGTHQSSYGGGTFDAFLANIDSNGAVRWSTYFGGSGDDQSLGVAYNGSGHVYITGRSSSTSGIATSGNHQTTNAGGADIIIAKFEAFGCEVSAIFTGDTSVCTGSVKNYTTQKETGISYTWSVSGGSIVSGQGTDSLTVIWTGSGTAHLRLIKSSSATCKDTFTQNITIHALPQVNPGTGGRICYSESTIIGDTATPGFLYTWSSNPAGFSSSVSSPKVSPSANTIYILTVTDTTTGCTMTDSVYISVNPLPKARFSAADACIGEPVYFADTSELAVSYLWYFGDGDSSVLRNPTHLYSKPGTYNVSLKVISMNGCMDSASSTVTISQRPQALISGPTNACPTSSASYKVTTNDTNITYNWKITGGNLVSGQNTDSINISWNGVGTGFVKVILTNTSGCKDSVEYAVKIDSFGCDWVWPGDANNNKIANAWDVLNIAVAYNDTGASRKNANANWAAQYADNWPQSFRNGVNFKHADCNGDGVVDSLDLLPIISNYGKNWNKKSNSQTKAGPTDPALILEFPKDSFSVGDTVHLAVKLGTQLIPANDVYGLAFSFTFNPALVEENTVSLNLSNSWLGTAVTNMISLVKEFHDKGYADVAIARTDKKNQSGYGIIGTLNFVIKDDIAGKNTLTKLLSTEILELVSISVNEDTIPLNVFGDSAIVYQIRTSVNEKETELKDNIRIYPNPSSTGNFILDLKDVKAQRIQVINMLGQEVYSASNMQGKTEINLNHLNAGYYMVNVFTASGIQPKLIIINK